MTKTYREKQIVGKRNKNSDVQRGSASVCPSYNAFDGTTAVCQATAIVDRCVEDDFTSQQCLLSLKLAVQSITGDQLARRLLQTLAITYQIEPRHLIATFRDRVSVNTAAVRHIRSQTMYEAIFDVGRFPHMLDYVGRAISGDQVK